MTAVLETSGLAAGYGGRPVISGIDVVLQPGEVLCMIGHNGAGKSTLLKAMFGLLAPEAGTVRVDGRDVTGQTPRAIADLGVAMVPRGGGSSPRSR
jgi:branched-chain amino acid transport system ATP-binding protein